MNTLQQFRAALDLAICAPTEGQATRAIALAEELAVFLTPLEISNVKSELEES